MADAFDPYLSWLGIRSGGNTPDHYRLLGLELFESDADVIATAADRQMKHVRTLQTGKHAVLSQRILNELAAARLCLLKPDAKRAYDEKLRAAVKARKAGADAAGAAHSPPSQPAVARPRAQAAPMAVAAVAMPTGESELDLGSPVMRRKRPVKKTASKLPLLLGGAAVLIVGGALFAYQQMNAGRPIATGPGKVDKPAAKQPGVPPVQPAKTAPSTPGSDVKPAVHHAPEVIDQPEVAVAPSTTPPDKATPATGDNDPEKTRPVEDDPSEDAPKVQPVPLLPSKQPGAAASRAAVPLADDQKEALKKVKDVFAKEYAAATSPEKRFALAEVLLKQGLDAKDDRVNQYVLFDQAREMAVRAGRPALALRAIDELGKRFVLDAQLASSDALIEAGKSVRGAAGVQELLDNLASVADQLAAGERYDLAVRLAQAASSAAAKAKNPDLMKQAAGRLKELQEAQKAYDVGQKAAESLAANPDDPEANLQRGRYLCLVKDDWQAGLPLLAKSADAPLAAAAKLDLADPKPADKQAAAGDAWWEYGNRAKGLLKELALSRAQFWYAASLPKLQGLDKTRIEKRIAEHSQSQTASGGAGKTASRPDLLKMLMRNKWRFAYSHGQFCWHSIFAPDGRFFAKDDPNPLGTWTLKGNVVTIEFPDRHIKEVHQIQRDGTTIFQTFENGTPSYHGTGAPE